MLTSAASGAEETVRVDHAVEPLLAHDRFLLCSDAHGGLEPGESPACPSGRPRS
ncbi:MAG: hypothetical protein U1E17_03360 [Geminicoccaceae bacterium]